MAQRIITENNYIIEQPTVQGIVDILQKVISAQSDIDIEIGEDVSGERIGEIFGRQPNVEGINYCRSTKKLFLTTKIGSDNATIINAGYNDYWRMGKIYYEGKGMREFQKITESNLHMYRKYQVFHQKIRCAQSVEPYVHVFNTFTVDNKNRNIHKYLGRFDVTDFLINEHSISNQSGHAAQTKNALIFVLTPLCTQESDSIDSNYIFSG